MPLITRSLMIQCGHFDIQVAELKYRAGCDKP